MEIKSRSWSISELAFLQLLRCAMQHGQHPRLHLNLLRIRAKRMQQVGYAMRIKVRPHVANAHGDTSERSLGNPPNAI